MNIDLKKLGKHEVDIPKSLATCVDFVSIWGSEPNRAQLGRLCAAAIAVGVDHSKVLPAYKISSGDPIMYGHKIMDRLLDAGVLVPEIYDLGSQVLIQMMQAIPTEEAVDNTANFS